jgi:multidrug efflux pump subunit AcrA (membrane-fusion protein)
MLKPFPHADFLNELEQSIASGTRPTALPPALAHILLAKDDVLATTAAMHLGHLLQARKAVLQAAHRTEQVADELRRYQKFAKPGRPSPHIVQLRQQQAAARQASSQSRQALIKAAAAFVREAGIELPQRLALEPFITGWIEANVPQDVADSTRG